MPELNGPSDDPASWSTNLGEREFRRHMARFELSKARRLAAEGRPERAAVALRRARLWRTGERPKG